MRRSITLTLDTELFEAFKIRVREEGRVVSRVIDKLMRDYLAGNERV
jgi:hypothetical protein